MGRGFNLSAVLSAAVVSGCATLNDLPPAEQKAVTCAAQWLSAAPGVHDVKVLPGRRTIIRYVFTDLSRQPVKSRIRIDGWAPPGKPASYYFEILDTEFLGSQVGTADIRDLISACNLGQTVVTD